MENGVTDKDLDYFLSSIEKEPTETIENCISCEIKEEVKALSCDEKIMQRLFEKDKGTDIFLKKVYGWVIIGVLLLWECFVIIFSFLQISHCTIKISDAVFIALLTSATANIIALPTIILKYLFPNQK